MKIGLTCDLASDWAHEVTDPEQLGEFDAPGTPDAITSFLERRGHQVQRIGRASALIRALAGLPAGTAPWDMVFNICEGLLGPGREALVPALLEAATIPGVFSDSLVLALTLHKGHTKRIVRDAGLPTAAFGLLDHPAGEVAIPFPVFAKPVAEGTGKGIGSASLCETPEALRSVATALLARFRQPVLVETWLPGREFTVGITGTGPAAGIIGVMEIHSPATYGYVTKKSYAAVRYTIPDDPEAREAGRIALAAWRLLGCRDGGRVDLRSDAHGQPVFLEVNPLPGLHPVDSDLVILTRLAGRDYDWLLDRIMRSACDRAGLPWD